jgi:hypothetical protein
MSANDLINTLPQDLTNDIIIPNIVSTESIFIQSALPSSGAQGGKLFVSDGSGGLIANKLYFWESGQLIPEQVGEGGIAIQNEIVVKKNATSGEFASINAAVSYINSLPIPPSTTNRFNITVGPGDYIEAPLIIPSWVFISGRFGTTPGAINVSSSVAAGTLFTIGDGTSISNITINNLTNAAGIGINCNIIGVSSGGITIDNVTFLGTNGTAIRHTAGSIRLRNIRIYGLFQGIYSTDPMAADDVYFAGGEIRIIPAAGIAIRLETPSKWVINDVYISGTPTGSGIAISLQPTILYLNGGTIGGCGNALSVAANSGASRIDVSGTEFCIDNTISINILSNTAVGVIAAVAEITKVIIASAAQPNISLNITGNSTTAANRGVSFATDLRLAGANLPSVNLTSSLLKTPALGLVSGGVVSIGIGLLVSVTSGTGYLQNGSGNLQLIEWAQNTAVVIPANSFSYVYVDQTGTILASTTQPNLVTNVLLAEVISYTAVITAVISAKNSAIFLGGNQQQVNFEAFGTVYVSGSVVASITAGTQLSVNAGRFSFLSNLFDTAGMNPAVFDRIYSLSTINNISLDVAASNLVPLTMYNDIDTGLVAIPAGQFVSHGFYVTVDPTGTTKYFLRYGTAFFATQLLAEGFTFSNNFASPFVQIASIVVQQGSASLISIVDRRPFFISKINNLNTGVTQHNQLLGLTVGNDHPQYLLRAGTQPMTGSLDMGGNTIVNGGTYNSVTVEAHAARHLPSGADPLSTAAPVDISTANAIGVANSFARSDHVHNHANQPGGALHAAVTGATNGFMISTDKSKLDASTSSVTASSLMQRDVSGGVDVAYVNYYNTTVTQNVRITAPALLAASYTIILPLSQQVANQALTSTNATQTTWTSFTSNTTASTLMSRDTNADTSARRFTLSEGGTQTTIINGATSNWSLTLPINAGAAGQALTTDGLGVTSWTNFVTGTTSTAATANTIALRDASADLTSRRYILNNGTAALTLISGATSVYSLTLPINAGTAGQALTTDGLGVTSWTTVVAGTASTSPTADTVILRDNNADAFVRRINLRNTLAGTDVTILADPNTASSFSLTLPSSSGSASQVLTTAGPSGLLTWTSTAVASTANTITTRGSDGSISAKKINIDDVSTTTIINPSTANLTLGFPVAGTEIITNSGTQTLTNKTLTSPNMTNFTATGGTNGIGSAVGDSSGLRFFGSANSSLSPTPLNFYQIESVTLAVTGHNPATTISILFARIGGLVCMSTPGVQGTITGATVLTTAALPTKYLPGPGIGLVNVNQIIVVSNGTNAAGLAQLDITTGVMTFYADVLGTAFTVGGTRGPFSFTWGWECSRA